MIQSEKEKNTQVADHQNIQNQKQCKKKLTNILLVVLLHQEIEMAKF